MHDAEEEHVVEHSLYHIVDDVSENVDFAGRGLINGTGRQYLRTLKGWCSSSRFYCCAALVELDT